MGAVALIVAEALEPANASVPGAAVLVTRALAEELSDVRRWCVLGLSGSRGGLPFEGGVEPLQPFAEAGVSLGERPSTLGKAVGVERDSCGYALGRFNGALRVFLLNRVGIRAAPRGGGLEPRPRRVVP